MKSVLIAAAALAVATPAMADIVFSDTKFLASDYRTTVYAGPGISTRTFEEVGMGPVVGAMATEAVSTFANARNGQPARFQLLNNTFVYDPSVDGEITSIEAYMYQSLNMNLGGTPVNLTSTQRVMRLLAEQEGKLYEAFYAMNLPYSTAFQYVGGPSFVESDFLFFDPATPYAPRTLTGLDFGGSAITFGFELVHYDLQNNGAAPDTAISKSVFTVDELNITLRTNPPLPPGGGSGAVPEPSTWALLILGFGVSGAALRARRTRESLAA